MRFPRFVFCLFGATLPAVATTLSGRVIDPTGTGTPDVLVTFNGTTATTDGNGNWSLSDGNTGIASLTGRTFLPDTRLLLEDGHLRLSLSGHDPMGRPDARHVAPRPSPGAPRTAASGVDTLLYSWNGKTFLRDTASASRSGIVAIFDTTVNSAIVYGWLTDARDGQVYRTVRIGTQTWMAQNLNYRSASGSADSIGVCYGNIESNCLLYGRLYTWTETMAGASASTSVPSGVQGLCPGGWHLPSDAERHLLVTGSALDSASAGTVLKSANSWYNTAHTVRDSGGTDALGFRVLPAGYRYIDGVFNAIGYYAFFWSASEDDASKAWNWDFYFYIANTYHSSDSKKSSLSLRCLQD